MVCTVAISCNVSFQVFLCLILQRGQRGDSLVSMVRVEWNDKNLGESTKVECTADAPTELNHATSISINFDDFRDLDDVAYKPVLCEFY